MEATHGLDVNNSMQQHAGRNETAWAQRLTDLSVCQITQRVLSARLQDSAEAWHDGPSVPPHFVGHALLGRLGLVETLKEKPMFLVTCSRCYWWLASHGHANELLDRI